MPFDMPIYMQSLCVFYGTMLLYIVILIWFISKGWLVRAGLTTGVISGMPLVWQHFFTELETKGFQILFFTLGAFSLFLAAFGVIWWLGRTVNKWTQKKEE